jgi:hypothetical protein
VRRKLHRPVVGRRRGGSGFRRGFGTCWRDHFGRRDGFRDRPGGGRVLSSGRGARLVLRASSGGGTMRSAPRSLPLRSLRTAPITPTRHHPPETPLSPWVRASARSPASRGPRSPRGRSSFHLRQPNVGGKRSRRRRLQKARCNPQREQHRRDPKDRQPSLRPPDPDTHPPLSPGAEDVSPKL